MKKFILLALLPMLMAACSNTSRVRESVATHLESTIPGVTDFEIQVINDTVPYYLNTPLLQSANRLDEARRAYAQAETSDSLAATQALLDFATAQNDLNNLVSVARGTNRSPRYIALARFSTPSDTAARAIVIVDTDDTSRIIETFPVTPEFVSRYVAVKFATEGFNVKTNAFGRIDTAGLPPVDAFILAN